MRISDSSSGRLVVVAIAALATLASACATPRVRASGPLGGQAAGVVTSPTPSPHDAAPTGLDARTAAELVRDYVNADTIHDYAAMTTMTAGTIRDYWSWWNEEWGSCGCPPEQLRLSGVRTTALQGNRATVSLNATLTSDHVTRLTGPVHLVRRGGTWLVADYLRNGQSFARTIEVGGTWQTTSGVDARVLGLSQLDGGGDLWVELTDSRASGVRIVRFATVEGGRTRTRPLHWKPSFLTLAAGSPVVRDLPWWGDRSDAPLDGSVSVRVTFQDLSTGQRFTALLTPKAA